MDDGGPATTKWNDSRCNWGEATITRSRQRHPAYPPRYESVRSKLTEAICNICFQEATQPARRAELENKSKDCGPGQDADPAVGGTTRVGSPSPHPAFRVSRIPATQPDASTKRVEGRCHCHLSYSSCPFGLSTSLQLEEEVAGYQSRQKSSSSYRGPHLARMEVRALGCTSRATCRGIELVSEVFHCWNRLIQRNPGTSLDACVSDPGSLSGAVRATLRSRAGCFFYWRQVSTVSGNQGRQQRQHSIGKRSTWMEPKRSTSLGHANWEHKNFHES